MTDDVVEMIKLYDHDLQTDSIQLDIYPNKWYTDSIGYTIYLISLYIMVKEEVTSAGPGFQARKKRYSRQEFN